MSVHVCTGAHMYSSMSCAWECLHEHVWKCPSVLNNMGMRDGGVTSIAISPLDSWFS